jgi:uncharacterized protein
MANLEQFRKQNYLNLETYRRSGEGVKTPVWFVQDGVVLYVQTMANSGKVKRIHHNNAVNVVPCKMDGTPVGGWQPARAVEIVDDSVRLHINQLLDKKYGLMKKLFSLSARKQGNQNTILEIRLVE